MKILQSFLAAIVVFTRIPVRWKLPEDAFTRASLQLPLLGWMMGGLQWGILSLSSPWIGPDPALFIALFFPCLLSAGMHEDGLADFADGMLGGHSVSRRLEIMKDPRVGSYGVLALIFVIGGSFLALRQTPATLQGIMLLVSAVLSRGICIPMLGTLPYLNHAGSRSRGYIPASFHGWRILVPLWPLLPLGWLLPSWSLLATAMGFWLLLFWGLKVYLQKNLGGMTGDGLGAAIKLAEFSMLLWGAAAFRHGT